MGKYVNLTGRIFGNLTAIEPITEKLKSGHHKRWLCQCKCSNMAIVPSSHLLRGETKSCGCRNHKLSETRLYRIWVHMKNRCYNNKDQNYKNYGGRGIKVTESWLESFISFYEWSMANGYDEKLSIDRIDNDGDYSPQNCRWVTQKVQSNNTRWNHKLTLNGESHTISEWASIKGIKANTLTYRIKRGWSIERALSEEVKR